MYEGTLLPVTNRESWQQLVQITDPDSGDLFNITDYSVQFEVRRLRSGISSFYSGAPFYDSTCVDSGGVLIATVGNGVTIISTGIFQVYFTETQMRTLSPQTYGVGCTITDPTGAYTKQILRCRLPVLSGMVTN